MTTNPAVGGDPPAYLVTQTVVRYEHCDLRWNGPAGGAECPIDWGGCGHNIPDPSARKGGPR